MIVSCRRETESYGLSQIQRLLPTRIIMKGAREGIVLVREVLDSYISILGTSEDNEANLSGQDDVSRLLV